MQATLQSLTVDSDTHSLTALSSTIFDPPSLTGSPMRTDPINITTGGSHINNLPPYTPSPTKSPILTDPGASTPGPTPDSAKLNQDDYHLSNAATGGSHINNLPLYTPSPTTSPMLADPGASTPGPTPDSAQLNQDVFHVTDGSSASTPSPTPDSAQLNQAGFHMMDGSHINDLPQMPYEFKTPHTAPPSNKRQLNDKAEVKYRVVTIHNPLQIVLLIPVCTRNASRKAAQDIEQRHRS